MTQAILTRPDARPPVLIASHPRSGTHLVIDLLRRQFSCTRNWRWWGLPLDHLYLNLERLGSSNRSFSDALARQIVNRPQRALMKTHFEADFSGSWVAEESLPLDQTWLDLVAQSKIIYVVRHPLDVMCSYHQFLSAIDPDVAGMPLMTFMESTHWTGETDRLGWWVQHVTGWEALSGVTVLRYEDIVKRTVDALSEISEDIGETSIDRKPRLPPKITSITRTRMDRLFSLSPKSTGIVANRASFPAVKWQDVLEDAQKEKIETRLAPMLDRFGYSLSRNKLRERPWS